MENVTVKMVENNEVLLCKHGLSVNLQFKKIIFFHYNYLPQKLYEAETHWKQYYYCIMKILGHTNGTSLAPPLRCAGEGERAEESGDTAIQNLALSTDLGTPIRLLQACGSY